MSGKALAAQCEVTPIKSIKALNALYDMVYLALSRSSQRDITYSLRRTIALNKPAKTAGYGDLDIVVSDQYLTEKNVKIEEMAEILGAKHFAENGKVWSFEISGHQVDFIRVHKDCVYASSVLYGHGGATHLLRYIPRPFGYRLTDNGLIEKLKDGTTVIAELSLAKDWGQIYNIFCQSSHSTSYQFQYGFDNREDIYKAIYHSTMFTLGAFDLNERLEYVGKPERLDYAPFKEFIAYVKAQPGAIAKPVYPTDYQKSALKSQLKPFSTHVERRATALEDYSKTKLLANKYSGRVVTDCTGLTSKTDLSRFMEAYHKSFTSNGEFEFFLLSSSSQTIADSIQAYYVKYEEARLETVQKLMAQPTDAVPFG
jgi:hypothetical protein